jgi:hypothetical protein
MASRVRSSCCPSWWSMFMCSGSSTPGEPSNGYRMNGNGSSTRLRQCRERVRYLDCDSQARIAVPRKYLRHLSCAGHSPHGEHQWKLLRSASDPGNDRENVISRRHTVRRSRRRTRPSPVAGAEEQQQKQQPDRVSAVRAPGSDSHGQQDAA